MPLSAWEDNHPQPDEYGEFYKDYIELVDSPNVIESLIQQGQQVFSLIQTLSDEEAAFRYAENKWSVQEVLGHLIDTERIMAYRALCISRGEKKSLPGYDQDEYVNEANFSSRSLQNMSTEYDALRNANISMFSGFNEEQIKRKGTANQTKVSVRGLAYIIAGHEKHHLNILEEKYDIISPEN